jgi:non-specific serine/threonine protein kinase
MQGDYERAIAPIEESLSLFRELRDRQGIVILHPNLGRIRLTQGDYERAKAIFEESLTLSRELGDKWNAAWSLRHLGVVAQRQGDYGRAVVLHKESLILFRELEDKRNIPGCLENLAEAAGAEGQPERAGRLLGAAEALREATGVPMEPSNRADYDRSMAAVRAQLGEEAFKTAWAEGRKMAMEEAVGYALGKAT